MAKAARLGHQPVWTRGAALRASAVAFVAGLVTVAGFAGYDVWPLTFVCFVPVLRVVETAPRTRVLRLALLFGTVSQLGGYSWLLGTMRDFGGFPLPLAAFFLLCLCG